MPTARGRKNAVQTPFFFLWRPGKQELWMDAMKGRKAKPVAVLPMCQGWAPPSHLSPEAAAEFGRTVELLRQRGTLEFADREMVARRCEACELATIAYKAVQKDGPFAVSSQGNLTPHPAVKVHQDNAALLRLIDQTLGLVPPRDRARPDLKPEGGLSLWRAKVERGRL